MSPLKRYSLLGLGWLALAFGVAGIFLPLLPTTPFLLVTAYCFSQTSPRFHHWLMHHPRLGPPVRDWQAHGVIRLRVKIMATALVILTFSISSLMVQVKPLVYIILGSIMTGVMAFIWTRPSKPRGSVSN